jgi:hypothetical protein
VFWIYAVSKRRKSLVDIGDLDGQSEVLEAIEDLDSGQALGSRGRSSQYWPKIRERLLKLSSSEDIEEARLEWEDDGLPYKCEGGTCELCDKTPIKYQFPIKNRIKGSRLVVGSECIYNYLQIDGYEGPEPLRKKLVAQLNFLKKQERGEGGSSNVKEVGEVFLTESKVRRIIASIAGGEDDFDPKEYQESLREVLHVCNHLGAKGATVTATQQALIAITKVIKFMIPIQAKQKVKGNGLLGVSSAIMAKRSVEDRLSSITEYLGLLNSVAQFGPAKEVISRSWGVAAQERNGLLALVTKKCDAGKAQINADYRFELDMAGPYRGLKSIIEEGLQQQKAFFDSQVETVRSALEGDNFLELIQDGASALASALNLEFLPDLNNSDETAQHAAAQVCAFINYVTNGDLSKITTSIEELYRLENIRDLAGVKVALLRAANDSVIDADVAGKAAVAEFKRLLLSKDKRVLALIEEEVDEVADLVRASGGMRVFEKMGQDLEFDVQAAYKVYSSKNADERDFCLDLFSRWKQGQIRSLTPPQMSNIRKKMMGRRGEVPNSMWSDLKSELMTKFSIVR